jgi:hypothetical protein
MKKAKIILATLMFIAAVGGAFAFKAMRFNITPAWTYTNAITVGTGKVTYSTTGLFCYTTTVSFISTTGIRGTTLTSTNTAPSTTFTLVNASGATFTSAFPPCTVTNTLITTAP